jgi:hypothetical protein
VLTQLKPQPKRRWRPRTTLPRPPAGPAEPRPDEPEPRPRRPVAPPPAAATGWPAAWLSVGAAGAALVALAVLTLLG